ncbi:MAG: class I SAM-dependent methyltransferase [Verrucomicrobium sp.]|nr:class I SAM-dependent methyltransferase [Verrucomicrobium sp.]
MGERPVATTLASELAPDELACLLDEAQKANRGGRFLEIGTAAGGTLCQLINCLPADRRPPIVVVDPMAYFRNQLEAVRTNLTRHGINPDTVDFRVGTSAAAFPRAAAAGEQYDFILVDGAHKSVPVTQDLRWTRLLRPGGVVCFHDYCDAFKGVKWNVDRLVRRHPTYRLEKVVSHLAVVRKLSESPTPEGGTLDLIWAGLLSPLLQWERSYRKRRAGSKGC